MKTLSVPALLGVCLLTAVPLHLARAQMPFTASPMPNANPYAHSGYSTSAAPPMAAPVTAVPGAAYAVPGSGYPATMSAEPIDPDHKLGRGDRLSYHVVEDRDDKVIPLVVGDSGEVDVPLINRVKAAGKTPQQLSADIKSRLEQDYYYHATVVLGLDAVAPRVSRGTVYVSGAVMGSGSVELPLDAPLTVSQAISKMGGFKDFGNKRNVKVIRKGGPKKGYIVDVQAVEGGDLDKDFVLQPGDQVFVREKTWNISF